MSHPKLKRGLIWYATRTAASAVSACVCPKKLTSCLSQDLLDKQRRSELQQAALEQTIRVLRHQPMLSAGGAIHLMLQELNLVLRTQRRYSFIYMSYRPSMYQWECVVMLRKALMSFCAIMLAPVMSVRSQIAFGLILTLASLMLSIFFEPFQSLSLLDRHGAGYTLPPERVLIKMRTHASLHLDLMDPAIGNGLVANKPKVKRLPWHLRIPELVRTGQLEEIALFATLLNLCFALMLNDGEVRAARQALVVHAGS